MRRRALWAPKHLSPWDWRKALIDERRVSVSQYQKWSRPDTASVRLDGAPVPPRRVGPSLVIAWLGFTTAGLAALAFALSMIYGQLETALTGFPTAPLLPLETLASSGAGGLLLGILGLALASRRAAARDKSEKFGRDTPIAA